MYGGLYLSLILALTMVPGLVRVLEVEQYAAGLNRFDRVEKAYPTGRTQPFVPVGVVVKLHVRL